VLRSLDFVYVPTADVEATALGYVDAFGANLRWRVRGMGTTVACLEVTAQGPLILLAEHLRGANPILVYRVDSYGAAVDVLRRAGIDPDELEIPHGPCASFTAVGGQRYAVYELTRPKAASNFDGRLD